ncbi:MAG: FG-GAP-like repeat-containing protein [Acidobacteriota bacterium]
MKTGSLLLAGLGALFVTLLVPHSTGQPSGPRPDRSEQIVRYNNLGVAFMEQLKFDNAKQQFARIVELDPTFAPGHVNLGIAYFYLQDYPAALQSLGRALELDAGQRRAHYMSGLIYRNQDQIERALAEFSRVYENDPDDPSTNYFLGLLHSRKKEYATAADFLRRAIDRQPYNASARYNLAISLLRSGKRQQGQVEMLAFRKLQDQFGTDTIGLQYLEQGKYSLVIDKLSDYLPTSGSPSQIEVKFSEVAEDAGLRFKHGGPGQVSLSVRSGADLDQRIVPYSGSGLAFGDYDGDGWDDLFIANAAVGGASPALFHNTGKGGFEDSTGSAGIRFRGLTMAPLWGDFNNDAHLDLYLINYGANVLYQNNGDGTFTDVTRKAGVGDPSWGMSGAFVDYDHDGDLDIVVANFVDPSHIPASGAASFPTGFSGADNVLYRNNGDGTFADVSTLSGLAGQGRKTVGVMTTDFNNSRDVDFYFVNLGAPNQLFSNLRDGTFADVGAASGVALPGAGGIGIGDFNQDGLMDFALPSLRAMTSLLMVQQESGPFKAEDVGHLLRSAGMRAAQQAQFLDFDNDGDLDLLLSGTPMWAPNSSDTNNLALLANEPGGWKDVSEKTGLNRFKNLAIRGLAVSDYDNDGDLDFAATVNGAAPLLLRNEGGNQNHWLELQLVGTNSNKMGVGTKVQIMAGRHWQKMEVVAGNGWLSQSSSVVHFGLGKKARVDVVRLLWPGGVLQSETDRPINRRIQIQELDRKGTSCPILYVWDGDTYRFQTDFLGGSAFGYLLAPGVFNYPDTDEYIKLRRDQVQLKEGKLAVTLNNQLEEVIFFDKLRLLAVDHPADYEVYADEKLLPGPPYQDLSLETISRARPPRAAVDSHNRNVLPQIKKIDRVYPNTFRSLPYKGYAELHELILDLGPVSQEHLVLLMHAWIDYANSTSNLAASQANLKLVPPYLQVRDAKGEWVTVIERMGFPAGLPKMMTVDLSGKFLSQRREVKIVTNMRIYWDQILVGSGPRRDDFRVHRLTADYADLHFRGFPAFVSPDGREPKLYDYDRISQSAQWKVHIGGYTRFGDVLPLLEERDDRYVITRSGDEIEAFFDLAGLPELPAGWVRDYLLYVDGFGKDMDVNSARPDDVGPLPFHGMSAYPYPESESYPGDATHRDYLKKWNTRIHEHWTPPLARRSRRAPVSDRTAPSAHPNTPK